MNRIRKRLFGGILEIIADENETSGLFDLFNNMLEAGTEVPLHMHKHYSETFYVNEGRLTVFLKDQTIVMNAGDHIVIPSNTPHALLNSEKEPVKGILVSAPSGFAKLVKLVGVDPDSGEDVDKELFMKISKEIGDVLLGPPGSRP